MEQLEPERVAKGGVFVALETGKEVGSSDITHGTENMRRAFSLSPPLQEEHAENGGEHDDGGAEHLEHAGKKMLDL